MFRFRSINTLVLCLFGYLCEAQISFENGYIIDNQNIKTNCFIKNVDWLNNPKSIQYKFSENGEVVDGDIQKIVEFGVADHKFIRFKGPVDRSPILSDRLDYKRAPQFKEETIFLQEIVTGKAKLYSFIDGNLTLYYFRIDNRQVQPLIYKRYYKTSQKIGTNDGYRQQLFSSLNCSNMQREDLSGLDYKKTELESFFERYNYCSAGSSQEFLESKIRTKKKGYFNFLVRPGITINSFKIPKRLILEDTFPYWFDFEQPLGYQLGLEIEYVLPFNKNKWSFFCEPLFNTFKSTSTIANFTLRDAELKYNTFELPIGIKHYFFISPNSKVFLGGAYTLIFDLSSSFEPEVQGFVFSKGTNMFFGLGYDLKNKFRIEARIDTNRGNLFPFSNNYVTQFESYSLVLGLKLF